MTEQSPPNPPTSSRSTFTLVLVALASAIVTIVLAALVMNIFQRKNEARVPFIRTVEVDENTTDPAVWGMNWAREFDSYQRTVDITNTRYGGSEAMPAQKLDRDPWLKKMFSGYAFSIDYRDRRGHAYMLSDQTETERVTKKPQPGSCLHCHASIIPTYRRVGGGDISPGSTDFNWPAVFKGFEEVSAMSYSDAFAQLAMTPDGSDKAPHDGPWQKPGATTAESIAAHKASTAHPVSCVDCHDPKSMELRVSRPGFIRGIQALANSSDPVPHLQSIARWRAGDRKRPYDPNIDATRQEMRSFACAQCHVEYYCGPKTTLFFPWGNGLKADDIETFYDKTNFPDGTPFYDFVHGVTGAHVYKAQHPEFETWSQGVHARAGVACADCHMPYVREGAMKVSDHWIRSPLLMVNRSCQVCHSVPEPELIARVETIQGRTHQTMNRASVALVDMIDAIALAKANGASPDQLKPALDLHRKAQWRLDFVYAENSMGFHASQETQRVLSEAIDYARQGQLAAVALRAAPPKTSTTQPTPPVEGVTPPNEAPPGPYRTNP
ncbi:MAG TPA: ammonia-forming cytochrome c nitrite reductase subunit c552 [Pirellulales bacterium]|nr:ammonia-forming cytochrome c nitrite reductase subunit c552 [Pirellulales bacterium]